VLAAVTPVLVPTSQDSDSDACAGAAASAESATSASAAVLAYRESCESFTTLLLGLFPAA
jgi:hypothetical protein